MLTSDLDVFGSLPHLLSPMGTPRRSGRHRGPSRPSPTTPAALRRPHRPSRLPSAVLAAGVSDAADRELLAFNVRLAKQRQGLLDTSRIERKAFREHARIENAVAAYARELGALLPSRDSPRASGSARSPPMARRC